MTLRAASLCARAPRWSPFTGSLVLSRAVADALHDLLDPGKKEEAEKARKEIERLARQREERAARLVEFDAAKEDAADASHMVQKARHAARELEARTTTHAIALPRMSPRNCRRRLRQQRKP